MLPDVKYDTAFGIYFLSWFFPVLLVFGVGGNTTCLLVLIKRKPFPADVLQWFTAFSITQLFVLVTAGVDHYISSVFQISLRNKGPVICRLVIFITYVGYFSVCWTQTGISVLRAYATMFPMRRNAGVSRRKTIVPMLIVFVSGVCITSACTISTIYERRLTNDSQDVSICYGSDTFVLIDFVAKDAISFILIFSSSILIIYNFRKAMSRYNISQYQRRTTLTLLGMNVTYFVSEPLFNLYIILAGSGVILHRPEEYKFTQSILQFLTYVDLSTNWLFFFVLGRRFRKYLGITLRRRGGTNMGQRMRYPSRHQLDIRLKKYSSSSKQDSEKPQEKYRFYLSKHVATV